MALFKIFKGLNADLPKTLHEGYAYFVEDTGALYIDVSDVKRVQVNALYANGLKLDNGDTIDADDILTTSDTIGVDNGGTGQTSLTANAILVGNGTGAIKMITIAPNQFAVGDGTNGLVGKDAAAARELLSVYNKTETDSAVKAATTVAYTATLTATGWTSGTGEFSQAWPQTALTCGKSGTVPPIISYTDNQDEYSKIDRAEATKGVGITFYTKTKPSKNISIVIVDIQ